MKFPTLYPKNFSLHSPWFYRWKKRLMVVFAVLLPGISHLLKKRVIVGSILCVLGMGSLIDLALSYLISYSSDDSVMRSFDMVYSSIVSSGAAFPDLKSITGETKDYLIQPWFWQLLIGHLALYAGSAVISGCLQWKSEYKE